MWLLTCDGDLFGHKPIWLRPGSTHLLGRTTAKAENGERVRYIEHKGVSRKHLLIQIAHVQHGDSAQVHSRSQVTLTDNSKTGSTLNQRVKLHKEDKILDKTEYEIKLGSYEHVFHLKWQPVVMTFTNLPKSLKSRGDALGEFRQKLEQTDVKLITEYLSNTTTHVVANKRNNPSCLQALAQARWPVNYAFVDALTKATARTGNDANGDPNISLMEEDFHGNWPSEMMHLIPSGPEPVQRTDDHLRPNPQRSEVFSSFTFVFMLQSQYDTLLAPITSCGGKAILREVHAEQTTVSDFVDFTKELAGSKSRGRLSPTRQRAKGGVVVIRPSEQKENDEWWKNFDSNVQRALRHRSVHQSEFLDAILTLDTTSLRKPLDVETADGMGIVDPSGRDEVQQHESESNALLSTGKEAEQDPSSDQPSTKSFRNKPRRFMAQSRFKGFDDFDPSQLTRPSSPSPEPMIRSPSQAPSVQPPELDGSDAVARPQGPNKKRPLPVAELEDDDEMMGKLFPGTAAMKKQRIEAQDDNANRDSGMNVDELQSIQESARATRKKQKEDEFNVRAELQARRDRAEEERRKDEEALREQLQGVDISELRNLVEVEEFEIPVRQTSTEIKADDTAKNERWDPAWNGRKNFKTFRRRGRPQDDTHQQPVIVQLEEVPRKGQGVGEEYWLNQPSATSSANTRSQGRSQSLYAAAEGIENHDPAPFRRSVQSTNAKDDGSIPSSTDHAQSVTTSKAPGSTASQTITAESQRKAAGKRPATEQSGPQAKRLRQGRFATAANLDDDDDDELKFRRRRR